MCGNFAASPPHEELSWGPGGQGQDMLIEGEETEEGERKTIDTTDPFLRCCELGRLFFVLLLAHDALYESPGVAFGIHVGSHAR